MKIRILFSYLGMLIFALFITNCDKNQFTPSTADHLNQEVTSRSESSNPYDDYGVLHNQGLSYVLTYKSEMQGLLDDEQALRAFIAQKTDDYLSTIDFGNNDEPINWDEAINGDVYDIYGLINEADLTDYEKVVLTDFYNEMQTYDFKDGSQLAAFADYAENLALNVQNDDQITDKEGVLSSISIGKHSAQYWSGTADDDVSTQGIIIGAAADAFFGLLAVKNKKKHVLGRALFASCLIGMLTAIVPL